MLSSLQRQVNMGLTSLHTTINDLSEQFLLMKGRYLGKETWFEKYS